MLFNIRFISYYSMLMGYLSAKEIIDYALKYNHGYVSVCDINFMAINYDISNFSKEVFNIPGITLNVYLDIGDIVVFGLVSLIINNECGYNKICKVFNTICINNPTLVVDLNQLIDYLYGKEMNDYFSIIIGNKGSILHSAMENGVFNKLIDYLYQKLGDNLFIAYATINAIECKLMDLIITLRNEINIIISHPVLHINRGDVFKHLILYCIKNKSSIKNVDADNDNNIFGDEYIALSSAELGRIYKSHIHDRGRNTFDVLIKRLSNLNNIAIDSSLFKMDNINYENVVINKVYRMFTTLITKVDTSGIYKSCADYYNRLLMELRVYNKIGVHYFVYVVHDFVTWARNNCILVGPGRGSCVGSLVMFVLNITSVDPVKHDLLFERFLNEYRFSEPDIDIDVCAKNRELLLKYVQDKYQSFNSVNVVHIVAFLKFVFKSAVKDIARAYGNVILFSEINKILAKSDDSEHVIKILTDLKDAAYKLRLSNCYNSIDRLALSKVVYYFPLPSQLNKIGHSNDTDSNSDDFLLFKGYVDSVLNKISNLDLYITRAKEIAGCLRGYSVHPSGILISCVDLMDKMILYTSDDNNNILRTQVDLSVITKSKVLKYDILGLDTLSVVSEITSKCNISNMDDIVSDIVDNIDNKFDYVYQCIGSALTKGIFQMDNYKAARLINTVKIDCFDDIIAINALNRPGTVALVDKYVRNKFGISNEEISEMDKLLMPVTKDTYGIILFQEQIMIMANKLLGYDLGEADVLRYAIGKKKPEIIANEKDKFYAKCTTKNISHEVAKNIFTLLENFANYAFNKSHAVAYSYITVCTAYLKAEHTDVFFETMLYSKHRDKFELIRYFIEILRFFDNIVYVSPDMLHSSVRFKITSSVQSGYTYLFMPLVIINNVSEENVNRYKCQMDINNNVKEAVYRSDIATPIIVKMFKIGAFRKCSVQLEDINKYSSYMKLITKKKLSTKFLFDIGFSSNDNKQDINYSEEQPTNYLYCYNASELGQVIEDEISCYDFSITKLNIVSLFFNTLVKPRFVQYLYIASVNVRYNYLVNLLRQHIMLDSNKYGFVVSNIDLVMLYRSQYGYERVNITSGLVQDSKMCILKLGCAVYSSITITFYNDLAKVIRLDNLIVSGRYQTINDTFTTETLNINYLYLIKLIENKFIVSINCST